MVELYKNKAKFNEDRTLFYPLIGVFIFKQDFENILTVLLIQSTCKC